MTGREREIHAFLQAGAELRVLEPRVREAGGLGNLPVVRRARGEKTMPLCTSAAYRRNGANCTGVYDLAVTPGADRACSGICTFSRSIRSRSA
jgi:hypothetical protein